LPAEVNGGRKIAAVEFGDGKILGNAVLENSRPIEPQDGQGIERFVLRRRHGLDDHAIAVGKGDQDPVSLQQFVYPAPAVCGFKEFKEILLGPP